MEGVGVDTLESRCSELAAVNLVRIWRSSVTGWGACSSVGMGASTAWNLVNLANVFRFLQHKTPQRLHIHWDNNLLQHMAISVKGKTHQVVRYVKVYSVQNASPTCKEFVIYVLVTWWTSVRVLNLVFLFFWRIFPTSSLSWNIALSKRVAHLKSFS